MILRCSSVGGRRRRKVESFLKSVRGRSPLTWLLANKTKSSEERRAAKKRLSRPSCCGNTSIFPEQSPSNSATHTLFRYGLIFPYKTSPWEKRFDELRISRAYAWPNKVIVFASICSSPTNGNSGKSVGRARSRDGLIM